MVGQQVAVFTSIEVKTPTGRIRPEQQQWLETVQAAGGIAGVARQCRGCVTDYDCTRLTRAAHGVGSGNEGSGTTRKTQSAPESRTRRVTTSGTHSPQIENHDHLSLQTAQRLQDQLGSNHAWRT
jgi:hypothetical protein